MWCTPDGTPYLLISTPSGQNLHTGYPIYTIHSCHTTDCKPCLDLFCGGNNTPTGQDFGKLDDVIQVAWPNSNLIYSQTWRSPLDESQWEALDSTLLAYPWPTWLRIFTDFLLTTLSTELAAGQQHKFDTKVKLNALCRCLCKCIHQSSW